MTRKLVTAAVLAMVTYGAAAEYRPPDGGLDLEEFVSPLFSAGGPNYASTEAPSSDFFNPASSAGAQRISADLSYHGLVDLDSARWGGHALGIGLTLPNPAFVLSGNLFFATSGLDDMDLGTLGRMRVSISKDLFPNLYVGAAIDGVVGEADTFDFGIAADIGFLHRPGTLGPLSEFSWGFVLQDLGKWYQPVHDRTAFPAPFTPAVGAQARVLDTPDLRTDAWATLALPTFANLRIGLGGQLIFRDFLFLTLGLRADLRQLWDEDLAVRSFIPSLGIGAVFQTDLPKDDTLVSREGWNRSEVRPRISAAPLHSGVWAFGTGVNVALGVLDRNPPVVDTGSPDRRFLSPNLDGAKDELVLPLSIRDERYVTHYRVIIKDSGGRQIRTIENKERREENETFTSILDRLTTPKTGIAIPSEVRWDGRGDSGAAVADGEYSVRVEAVDDNGNIGVSHPISVIIDATAPVLSLTPPQGADLVFSPNGDGIKDSIRLEQSGSVEDRWSATIRDQAGKSLRTFVWSASAPTTVEWDGTGDDGVLVPDGVYHYRIEALDPAGNRTLVAVENIIVNTDATPISLAISGAFLSPNGDGRQDTLTITPVIPVTVGIQDWTLSVNDARGNTARRFSGGANAPTPLVFDGLSDAGGRLPEGSYRALLRMRYRNGNSPEAFSPTFVIDVTPPTAEVAASAPVFSPNGDGRLDTVVFSQQGSQEELWTGSVTNREGRVVRSTSWLRQPDPEWRWNGLSEAGNVVPDGEYAYRVEAVDRAGNRGGSKTVMVAVDTGDTPVILTSEFDAFSPNNDGVKDYIKLFPVLRSNENIAEYSLSIRSAGGDHVRTIVGRNRMASYYQWDGLDNQGRKVPDGTYQAELFIRYLNGNEPRASSAPFDLDTQPPRIELSLADRVFSPDGDGRKDGVRISQESTVEPLWEGLITNEGGEVQRRFAWTGRADSFQWDGTDESGNPRPDGSYGYRIYAVDRAGNRGEARADGIRIDTRRTQVFVTASARGVSPNNDGIADSIRFSGIVNLIEGVESWSLRILPEGGGEVIRSFGGTSVPTNLNVDWNGLDARGRVQEGRFIAEFSVVYVKGNLATARTPMFVVDVSGPAISVSLTDLPFSPDNDGINDELVIRIGLTDASPVTTWRMEITDPGGQDFIAYSGVGNQPPPIRWDGESTKGELVFSAEDYPYEVRAVDAWGNEASQKGAVPVDILVIRDGDRLKIRISNITFAPNSPLLIADPSEKGVRNIAVLKRLAEVLTKYGSYRVRIEGHANNISGTEREEVEELMPLSTARANTVRHALIQLGISSDRLSAVGKGGKEMIFPFRDEANRWKNRRVEFILLR